MMRKMLFTALATLAVMFGSLAVASAAPRVGDGSSLTTQGSPYVYDTAGG
jgi:ABC-type oligopeptide transport system substrate-binding subunit